MIDRVFRVHPSDDGKTLSVSRFACVCWVELYPFEGTENLKSRWEIVHRHYCTDHSQPGAIVPIDAEFAEIARRLAP